MKGECTDEGAVAAADVEHPPAGDIAGELEDQAPLERLGDGAERRGPPAREADGPISTSGSRSATLDLPRYGPLTSIVPAMPGW